MKVIWGQELIFGGASCSPRERQRAEFRVGWRTGPSPGNYLDDLEALALCARQDQEVGVPREDHLFRAFLWGQDSVAHHGSQLLEIGKVLRVLCPCVYNTHSQRHPIPRPCTRTAHTTPIYNDTLSHMHTPAVMYRCVYTSSVCTAEHTKSSYHTPQVYPSPPPDLKKCPPSPQCGPKCTGSACKLPEAPRDSACVAPVFMGTRVPCSLQQA